MVWVGTSLNTPWRGVSVGQHFKRLVAGGSTQDGSNTYMYIINKTYMHDLVHGSSLINLVPIAMRLENCQRNYKPCSLTLFSISFLGFYFHLAFYKIFQIHISRRGVEF